MIRYQAKVNQGQGIRENQAKHNQFSLEIVDAFPSKFEFLFTGHPRLLCRFQLPLPPLGH